MTFFSNVRVPHPLEQGLRRSNSALSFSLFSVRVPHPLEQGLRHFYKWILNEAILCQSAPSIRTRIKTPSSKALLVVFWSECPIH